MSQTLPSLSVISLKPKNGDDHLVQLSVQLSKKLQLEKEQELTLRIGRKNIKMVVETAEIAPNEILLPEKIIKEFCLPLNRCKFLAKYDIEAATITLGPIVGLLTDFKMNEEQEPHFRSIHTFCEELHHGITENGGFFYVFSFEQFPLQGYYFENGKWTPSELPLPDVVYNRIHSRILENAHSFKAFRKRLEQYDIPIFNDRFLSKWEVYEYLIQEERLHAYIPETKIFTKENLAEFLDKYETLFIKPVHGSQGRNIIKISKEETHFNLQCSLATDSNKIVKIHAPEDIYEHIKTFQGNKIYIIQQGIPLLTIEECAVDFRALCHKNSKNLWEVTSIVARISHKDEIVSNIARGGTLTKPLQALRAGINQDRPIEILTQMKELSIETAAMISRYSSGITGELGIDIGVTSEGKIWLIEVNSKPSKKFEDDPGKIRPSAKAILQISTKMAFDATTKKEES